MYFDHPDTRSARFSSTDSVTSAVPVKGTSLLHLSRSYTSVACLDTLFTFEALRDVCDSILQLGGIGNAGYALVLIELPEKHDDALVHASGKGCLEDEAHFGLVGPCGLGRWEGSQGKGGEGKKMLCPECSTGEREGGLQLDEGVVVQ